MIKFLQFLLSLRSSDIESQFSTSCVELECAVELTYVGAVVLYIVGREKLDGLFATEIPAQFIRGASWSLWHGGEMLHSVTKRLE